MTLATLEMKVESRSYCSRITIESIRVLSYLVSDSLTIKAAKSWHNGHQSPSKTSKMSTIPTLMATSLSPGKFSSQTVASTLRSLSTQLMPQSQSKNSRAQTLSLCGMIDPRPVLSTQTKQSSSWSIDASLLTTKEASLRPF